MVKVQHCGGKHFATSCLISTNIQPRLPCGAIIQVCCCRSQVSDWRRL